MKKNFGKQTYLYPMPVLIIATYDEDGNEIPNDIPNIGVSIISLPRNPETVDEFLKLVGPYVYSEVSTIGICHYYDYGKTVAYYYIDGKGCIKKHIIKTSKKDETLLENQ